MNRIRIQMIVCALAVEWANVAAPALAQSPLRITSPTSDTWIGDNAWVDLQGDAPEPGQVTHLLWWDSEHDEWHTSYEITASTEPFTDARGETRYAWNKSVTTGAYEPSNFGEPGPTRDEGQRSNQLRLGIEGALPLWIDLYSDCGRDGQPCCLRSDSYCDGDLECSQDNRHCQPKPEAPPTPPKPPAPQPGTQCGGVGQSCCTGSQRCNNPNSLCDSDRVCTAPGNWWQATCVCNDTVNWWYINRYACANQSTSLGQSGLACGLVGCDFVTTAGPDLSQGECALNTYHD